METPSLTGALEETLAVFETTATQGEPMTTNEVTERLDVSRRSTYARLERLVEQGLIETKKAGARGRVWWQPRESSRPAKSWLGQDEQFQLLDDATEEYAIILLERDGTVTSWNAGAERITGHEADEIVGENVSVFYTDEDRADDVPKRNLAAARSRGHVEDKGFRVRKDGSRFWANVSISAVSNNDGGVEGYAKVVRDMTERRNYERQRRRERELMDRLLETAPVRIGVYRPDGTVERVNSLVREELGVDETAEERFDPRELTMFDEDGNRLSPEDHPVQTVLDTGEFVRDHVVRHEVPGGEQRWAAITASPLYDDDGDIERVVVAGNDITELKRTERQLARKRDELEAELEEVFERITDGFYGLDEEFRLTYVNEHAATLLGLEEESVVGTDIREAVALTNRFEAALSEALDDGAPVFLEDYYEPLGGWFVNAIYPSETGLSVYFRDVTERKQRERELERYAGIIDAVDEPAYALDAEGRFTFVNEPMVEYSGYDESELLGGHVSMGMDDDAIERVEELMGDLIVEGEETATIEFEVVTNDGERIPAENRFALLRDETGEFIGTVGVLWDVTERKEHQEELERQRERLAALNNLYEVVRDITDAVIEQSTRAEIERVVCEDLAASESYEFAWLGDADVTSQEVTVRAEAGAADYLEEVTISVDPDDQYGRGPAGRAIRTGEVQTTHDVHSDDRHTPWLEAAEAHGYRSGAAIPVTHDETTYGVLCVYAARPNAFQDEELAVIGQLGEIVGHAITAVERKRALLSDEVVELKFRIPDATASLDVDGAADGRIDLVGSVPIGDDEYLVYGRATENAVEVVEALVETVPHWAEVTFRNDEGSFELLLADPPVLSVLTSLGGSFEESIFRDGDYYMTVHLAPGADVRRLIDAVQAAYPTVEMLTRRQITRAHDNGEPVERTIGEGLTDRQRTVLRAAYHANFFEWPREISGEEIASSLGVSSPTFHQHLRLAEKKVFDSLLSNGDQRGRTV